MTRVLPLQTVKTATDLKAALVIVFAQHILILGYEEYDQLELEFDIISNCLR